MVFEPIHVCLRMRSLSRLNQIHCHILSCLGAVVLEQNTKFKVPFPFFLLQCNKYQERLKNIKSSEFTFSNYMQVHDNEFFCIQIIQNFLIPFPFSATKHVTPEEKDKVILLRSLKLFAAFFFFFFFYMRAFFFHFCFYSVISCSLKKIYKDHKQYVQMWKKRKRLV